VTTREQSAATYLERRRFGRLLGKRGWLYPAAPKEYGGAGLDLDRVIVLEEESHALGISLPPYYDSGGKYGAASILAWGTEEQKATMLPPIFRGEVRTWQLLSEPEAGSDLANVKSTAIRRGDHYVLNGQKVFVGSDHGAERLWVLAVTDRQAPRHHNLSWFMIDAALPGITVTPQTLLANHGEGEGDIGCKNTVYFTDVEVPAECLVGGENNGWKVAGTHLDLEHGGRGNIRRDRNWPRLLAQARSLRDAPGEDTELSEDELCDAIGEIFSRIETVRLLGLRNFWMAANHTAMTYEGAQLAYVQKTTGLWLAKAIHDLLGPSAVTAGEEFGAMDGYAEEQHRDGIVNMHPGGTTDIQRMIMARRLGVDGRDRGTAR